MSAEYFEEFQVGETSESVVARTISESDVYDIAGLAGSYSELHTNKEYMANTEFGRRLVQNTLLIVIMEGLWTRLAGWDPNVVAAYGRDDLRFLHPVFIDDTVKLEAEVVDKERKGEDRGVVTFEQKLYNQDGDLTVVGEYLLLVESHDSDT